jgi:hypothetical protein
VTVELGGPRREPTLRAGCCDPAPHEVERELARDPMDGMALGHQAPIGWPAISPVASYSVS